MLGKYFTLNYTNSFEERFIFLFYVCAHLSIGTGSPEEGVGCSGVRAGCEISYVGFGN